VTTQQLEVTTQQLEAVPVRSARPRSLSRRFFRSAWLWLTLICGGEAALALRPGLNRNAFEDEGLYVYMGHRMIQHLLHGASLPEYPGSYFSGAPGLYPVLAAMADDLGGLAAARALSLVFVCVAIVATYGLGNRLFGRMSGLIGAAAFGLCGSVIYLAHFATYDAMTMALVAVGAWLAVYSAQRDGFAWAPVVALIGATAFLTKYAGAVYIPMIVALAVAVGWPLYGWKVVRRGIFALLAAGVMAYSVIELWGRSMIPGIESTTSSRIILIPASHGYLLRQIAIWVGPWLLLAVLGGLFRLRRQWLVVCVLLVASVIGPLDQVRIGEATSLAKHVAFGLIFAAPLIGDFFARGIRATPRSAVPAMLATLALLGTSGLHYSHTFLTGWPNDADLRPVLAKDIAAEPGQHILGDRYSPQRYELRKVTSPNQWDDTYYFSYGGKLNEPAYAEAIDQHYFGVIYLDQTTPYGQFVYRYLSAHSTYYHLTSKVPRYLHGQLTGHWYVYTPITAGG